MEIESCVQCGESTTYRITDHIDFRAGYIEGAGQLCIDCYKKFEVRQSGDSTWEQMEIG